MNATKTSQLENLCRTCMEGSHYYITKSKRRKNISIFKSADISANCKITIMELLMKTIPQLIIKEDDLLPKILCEQCFRCLIKIHEFQQMSIKTDLRFKDILNEQSFLNNQSISDDPLNDNVILESVNELLKLEMEEPPINDDDIDDCPSNSSDDDFKINSACGDEDFDNCSAVSYDVPTSADEDNASDKDNDWESEYLKTKRKGPVRKVENSNNLEGKHNLMQQKIEKDDLNCDICGKNFSTRATLKRHKRRVHSINTQDEERNIKEEEKSTFQFKCDECGSRLKTRKSLIRHKKIHLKTLEIDKDKPIKTTQTKNECEYCKKVFLKPSLLKVHILLHTGELPFLCSECGKSFRTASVLKQHLLRHGTEKPHACPDCPKSFSTISDLASHRAVHSKAKPHVCDVCGAGFVKAFYLKEHKMYHTGEKNHKCDYCDRRFVTGYQCRRHMLTHTGEKPHKCKYCDRAYTQRNELIKHLRIHLGDNVYKCSLCPQSFRSHGESLTHFNEHRHDDEETRLKNLQALQDEDLKLQQKLMSHA